MMLNFSKHFIHLPIQLVIFSKKQIYIYSLEKFSEISKELIARWVDKIVFIIVTKRLL